MAHDSITDENRVETMKELIGYATASTKPGTVLRAIYSDDPISSWVIIVGEHKNGHPQPRWSICVSPPQDIDGHHWPAQLTYSGVVNKAGLELLRGLDSLMWSDRET